MTNLMNPTQGPWTLDDWNAEQQSAWAAKLRKVTHPEEFSNGLTCPRCCASLYDTGQAFSGPPMKLRVKCMNPDCGFKGERIERISRISGD